MAMSRAHFRRQLQEGLNVIFGLEYSRYPDTWEKLFQVETSKKAYEEDVLMVGLAGAKRKAEGAGVEYDYGYEGWSTRYIMDTYTLATSITEEAMEDNLYMNVGKKMAKYMARSFKHTKEIVTHSVLNNGFDPNYAMGDGKAVLATDHPLAGGGTLENKLATPADLSETSLEALDIMMSNWTDDRGIPVLIRPKCLVVPTYLKFVAHRLTNTVARPGTANNDTNALRDMGTIPDTVVSRYLTDQNSYFIVTDCDEGLKFFRRKRLSTGVQGHFENGDMRYKARERYAAGISNPRGLCGSEGVSAGLYSGAP